MMLSSRYWLSCSTFNFKIYPQFPVNHTRLKQTLFTSSGLYAWQLNAWWLNVTSLNTKGISLSRTVLGTLSSIMIPDKIGTWDVLYCSEFSQTCSVTRMPLLWCPKACIYWIQKSPFIGTSIPSKVICEIYPHKSFCILHFEGEFLIFLQLCLFSTKITQMKAKSAGQAKTPFQKVKYFGGLSLAQRSDYLRMTQWVTQMNLSYQWYFLNVQNHWVRSPKIWRLGKYCTILKCAYYFSLWSWTHLLLPNLSLQKHGDHIFSEKLRSPCNPSTSAVIQLPMTMSSHVLSNDIFQSCAEDHHCDTTKLQELPKLVS